METPIAISHRYRPAPQNDLSAIGALIFPQLDQIDFTGPFEQLSRTPSSSLRETKSPVRDMLVDVATGVQFWAGMS